MVLGLRIDFHDNSGISVFNTRQSMERQGYLSQAISDAMSVMALLALLKNAAIHHQK